MANATPYYQAGPITLPTATDLSAKIGYAAKLSSGQWALQTSQGGDHLGVIVDTEVDAVSVEGQVGRVTTVLVGTNGVTQDAEITADTAGKFEDAGAADWVRMRALKTGAAGETVSAVIIGYYKKA